MNSQEMLKSMTAKNPELAKDVQDKLNRTRLVRCLINMRSVAGMSQAEVAKKMNCSQSRISKIEHGYDEDISIGELSAYTKATGFWFELSLCDGKRNATGLIKYHIMQANHLLNKIIQLADGDQKMLEGTDAFTMEVLVNFCRLLDDTTQKIPNSSFQRLLNKAKPRSVSAFEINYPAAEA